MVPGRDPNLAQESPLAADPLRAYFEFDGATESIRSLAEAAGRFLDLGDVVQGDGGVAPPAGGGERFGPSEQGPLVVRRAGDGGGKLGKSILEMPETNVHTAQAGVRQGS